MRQVDAAGERVLYLLGDHLGSTSLVLDASGAKVAESRYYPYGETRWTWPEDGTLPTDYRFTGARHDGYIKLYLMGARWYDSELGRWISPDTVVPDPANPQSLNRYSYTRNNPVKFVDPSGHAECASTDCQMIFHPVSGNIVVIDPGDSALYWLIALIARGDASAEDRLLQILKETRGAGQTDWPIADAIAGWLTRTHFRGVGGIPGDIGFAQEFRDDHLYTDVWGFDEPTSRQTGHFLTAVDMGYHEGWIHSIVAHELHADPGAGVFIQLGLPTTADILNFRAAMEADERGFGGLRDAALSLVLNEAQRGPVAERQGNSMEDLRLSIRGWRLGAMVANGQLGTNKDLANWIALNVAGD